MNGDLFKMPKKLIIYHGPRCHDGFTSSWVMHKKYPDAIFYSAIHGESPPNVSGMDVYIIDFSYPKEILLNIKKEANSLFLLDHHKSAQEELGEFTFCKFDMARSGAGLIWDHLFPGQPRNWLVSYIEDDDLWSFKLSNSREINAAIRSYPLTFDALDLLEAIGPAVLAKEGSFILRYQEQIVNDIATTAHEIEVCGYKVLCANTPILQSEVASRLSKGKPFGMTYFENEKNEKIYSLRSIKGNAESIDVSVIARKLGEDWGSRGGGHFSSAGVRKKA